MYKKSHIFKNKIVYKLVHQEGGGAVFCSNNALKSFICNVYCSFNSVWLLLFWIKSQPGVAYKSVSYKQACKVVLKSSKHEEITFPHGFIFMFIPYFIAAISSKKYWQKWGEGEIKRGEGGQTGEGVYKKGRSNLLHTLSLYFSNIGCHYQLSQLCKKLFVKLFLVPI